MPPAKRKTIPRDVCEAPCVNEQRVREALKTAPDDALVNGLAETFRALGDPNRIRIIAALSRHELCVCDLAALLRLTGSAVSHQLRLLRGQKLVRYRKEGKIAYYTLDDDHIRHLYAEGVRHVRGG
jgi:DNA-binding transcriptional ArsR family regulator